MRFVKTWTLALLFVAALILCGQDLNLFPWAHLAGLACFAALGWIANGERTTENG